MVARKSIPILFVLCLLALSTAAQNFSPTDTLTQYPHKGTFYHDRFVGRKTASGEIFDQNRFTAAHWKIKLGTFVLVTNQNTGLKVIVKVNDRCPKRGVFDLSHRAAHAIGIRGCQPVSIRLLPSSYATQWAAQEPLFDSVAVSPHHLHRPPQAAPLADTTPSIAAPQVVASAEVKTAKTTVPVADSPVATAHPLNPHPDCCCNIVLGTASSHADAYEKIQQLPEYYRNRVSVEPITEQDEFLLTLESNLPRSKATALSKALHHSFPDCKVACSE